MKTKLLLACVHANLKTLKNAALLCLAIVVAICSPSITGAQVNNDDSLALVKLYNSTNGPGWNNRTNWLTKKPLGTWFGVSVKQGRVDSLYLFDNNLSGIIPPQLGRLDSLKTLLFAKAPQ